MRERNKIKRPDGAITTKLLKVAVFQMERGLPFPSTKSLSDAIGASANKIDAARYTLARQKCLWLSGNRILEVRI